jgi:hypothetical protein
MDGWLWNYWRRECREGKERRKVDKATYDCGKSFLSSRESYGYNATEISSSLYLSMPLSLLLLLLLLLSLSLSLLCGVTVTPPPPHLHLH